MNRPVSADTLARILAAMSDPESPVYRGKLSDSEDYDSMDPFEDTLLPTISAIEVDLEWAKTQDWYQSVMNLSDTKPTIDPTYIVRYSSHDNTGWNIILGVSDGSLVLWDDEDVLGGNAPAYQGCYCHQDRVGVLEWIGELVSDSNRPGSDCLWF